jgi:ATP-dependent DNA helicase DinG
MKMNMPAFENGDQLAKLQYTMKTIEENEGRTLVLFQSKEELHWFKENCPMSSYPFYFEGEAEISELVKKFQEDEQSVLFSYHLWEGLDVPGPSLQNVVIHSLPFPPRDPVFEAKRNSVTDAFEEVDLPYMLLRLRQGIGRLIRTSNDSGTVQILIDKDLSEQVKEKIVSILPVTL